ncbi:MAG TPA: hypothetical protein VKF36_23450 [Syntrophorhabdales bacterium]|nr:hypothetical protein [Syntrophorhabdales bacterium]
MFIRSTGLGRTLLTARVANIQTTDMVPSTLEPPKGGATEPMRILMVMEVVHPVHWTVRGFVDPADLRRMAKLVLTNPALILRGLKFFFSKSPTYEEPGKMEAAVLAPVTAETKPATGTAAAPKAGPGPIPPRRQ